MLKICSIHKYFKSIPTLLRHSFGYPHRLKDQRLDPQSPQYGSLFNYLGILSRCFCASREPEKFYHFFKIHDHLWGHTKNRTLFVYKWCSFDKSSKMAIIFIYFPVSLLILQYLHTRRSWIAINILKCYVIHKCSHSIKEGDPNVIQLPKHIPNNNSKKKTLPINQNYM
jgi:hypothetical protein